MGRWALTDRPAAVIDALRSVHDPCCRERGISVVDMGLVRSVSVDDGEAKVELMLTSGWCPFATQVLSAVKEQAETVEGVDTASVDVTWDEAWTMDRLSESARRKLVSLPRPSQVSSRESFVRAPDQEVRDHD